MQSLGINIGSSNVKVTILEGNNILWSSVEPHEGNFLDTLQKILSTHKIPAGIKALATGTEGRYLLNMNSVIEPLCVEEALKHVHEEIDALVSLGGEDLVVYTIDKNKKIVTSFSGNKCASGTGEFFKQQLARMNMKLTDIDKIPENSCALKLSSRCSVFMKSDCTHRLNKGEAKTGDIVMSLSDVMAIKVIDFLKRAKIESGKVLLVGGVTQNQYILRFIRERMPQIEFIVPEQAPYFEAYGAALMAGISGSNLPPLGSLFKSSRIQFKRFKSLQTAQGRVTYLPSQKGKVVAGREYILGVDGGSTTTKACLIDIETDEVTASFYGRTHGDPISALKNCLIEIKKQIREDIGDGKISITLASTTGSSREILGVFLETPAVYNEIIAHAVGTTFYRPDIDTIFEIGGQDAKYVSLKNKVPIDYAMNEACSAGTGSFLEESASISPRRVLIIIGDGHDDASKRSLAQAIEIAQRKLVTIYCISTVGYGFANEDAKTLNELADATGGRVEYPLEGVYHDVSGWLSQPSDFDGNFALLPGTGQYATQLANNVFKSIANISGEINTQYIIHYSPDIPDLEKEAKKQYRTITVRVDLPNVRVRARAGYYPFAPE